MKRFLVDLSSFSNSEHDRLYHLIDDHSFFTEIVAGKTGIYIANWDGKESIESITGLPASLVRLC